MVCQKAVEMKVHNESIDCLLMLCHNTLITAMTSVWNCIGRMKDPFLFSQGIKVIAHNELLNAKRTLEML